MKKIVSAIFVYLLSCTLVLAQTAALLPNALQQYFDNNGNPLSSGTVGFYFPGTLNLKPVWQDGSEVTPWTNPITLDAGGKPPGGSGGIYGQGTYRQIVKDASNNTVWDAVTAAPGTNATAGTGDGDLVGTIKPWAGIQAPNQYLFAFGQQISRTTFSVLFTAITQSLNVSCTSGSSVLSGLVDTTQINIGAPVEVSCVVPGTVVNSKTSSTVTLSNNSSVNLNTTAVFFPFGNGDGSTTFTVPDLRGNVVAGRPNMGGTAASNLTTAFCSNPTAQGAVCGAQSQTLLTANLPNNSFTPIFTGTQQTWALNQSGIPTGTAELDISASAGASRFPQIGTITTPTVTTTPAGTNSTYRLNGNVTQTAFSLLQPTMILNYIIKVTPDVSSAIASGVTDLGGMVGSIACGTGITCTGNVISATGLTNAVTGGGSTVVGDFALWNNTTGTLINDGGFKTGTFGHAIPFLDGANTWSTTQVIPTVAGGSAAGSSVTVESTSNGSPSGDVANVFGSTINLRTPNNTGTSTVNCGNANATSCQFTIAGASSGAVTLQGSTGTYNFNFPTSAGTSGFPLLSGGGGSTAQTYGQLGNAALANMAAFTFKGNNTSGSATPTDVTIDGLTNKASPAAGDEMMIWDVAGAAWKKASVSSVASAGSVSSIAGNTGAFTLSHGLTNSVNDLQLSLTNATLQASPGNPGATSNASFTMMGMGTTCKLTPTYSTRIKLEFIGDATNSTLNDQANHQVRYGTGAAPGNGAAVTGTQIGAGLTTQVSTASGSWPFANGGIITGLSAGTAYWFDMALEAGGGGTASLTNISCNAMEF